MDIQGHVVQCAMCAFLTITWPVRNLLPGTWKWIFGHTLAGSAWRGDSRMLGYLLWLNPDVEAKESICESTGLLTAAWRGNLRVVELLLARGADIDARDKFGGTALMRSAESGSVDVARHLIERGADVNAVNLLGENAVLRAALHGHRPLLELLIAAGGATSVSTRGSLLDALTWAATWGHDDCVECLVKHGVNWNPASVEYLTTHATHAGNPRIQELMARYGFSAPQTL